MRGGLCKIYKNWPKARKPCFLAFSSDLLKTMFFHVLSLFLIFLDSKIPKRQFSVKSQKVKKMIFSVSGILEKMVFFPIFHLFGDSQKLCFFFELSIEKQFDSQTDTILCRPSVARVFRRPTADNTAVDMDLE